MRKLLIPLFTIVVLIVLGMSCADVPTDAPPFPEFKTKVRVIHAAADLSDVTVTFADKSVGPLARGNKSSYYEMPAGKKTFKLNNGESQKIQLDTDGVITVYVATRPDTTFPRFIKKIERSRMFAPKTPADTLASVIFAQMVLDSTLTVSGDEIGTKKLSFGSFAGFNVPANKDLSFHIINGADTLMTYTKQFSGGEAYTELVYSTDSQIKVVGFKNE